ncbi:hypothetical protein [Dolichospermum sp. UHCC 0315A]|uniref:hypothetical protein n=1 Tax=Dolichospermum sp. UHCC 0315A TaxID=1914871 RepID=UPI00143DC172|nr:hypothetical protein [Dolichospermum sp. UHCC 0315A]
MSVELRLFRVQHSNNVNSALRPIGVQESGVRSQESGVRSQESGVRSQESEEE